MARIPRAAGGSNDFYVSHDGRLVRGRLEPPLEDLLERRASLEDQIHDALMEAGMLKGKGFIVIDPANPRFSGEEFTDFEDAKAAGGNLAYTTSAGYAIVYAPVLVQRPRRDTADAQPSELLKQLGLPNGANVGSLPSPVPAESQV